MRRKLPPKDPDRSHSARIADFINAMGHGQNQRPWVMGRRFGAPTPNPLFLGTRTSLGLALLTSILAVSNDRSARRECSGGRAAFETSRLDAPLPALPKSQPSRTMILAEARARLRIELAMWVLVAERTVIGGEKAEHAGGNPLQHATPEQCLGSAKI
jgi:hypothetical protein